LSLTPTRSQEQEVTQPMLLETDFWQTAFEASLIPQFAIDLQGRLIGINEQAMLLFRLTPNDWERPFQELEPGQLISTHFSTKNFYSLARAKQFHKIKWQTANGHKYFDIAVTPVFDSKRKLLGSIVSYLELNDCKPLVKQLNDTVAELDKLRERLTRTELELKSAQQELQLLEQNDFSEPDTPSAK
jgi:PAS domain-containing protein